MITIHLNGERLEIKKGSTLHDLLPDHDQACCVAVIQPGKQKAEETPSLRIDTTAGEIVVEIKDTGHKLSDILNLLSQLKLHWVDRYAAAFGPFESSIKPDRMPHLYDRGDVILGCGGYDPRHSYLIFSKIHHSADFGTDSTGGIIGKVVSGRGVLDRWSIGDCIESIEPIISWADASQSFTTTDGGLILEEGMQIVSHLAIVAYGYSTNRIETDSAISVEHLLTTLRDGHFTVNRSASTHICDERRAGTDVPEEILEPRREGSVTVRTRGKSRGSIYIYTTDVPSSPAHSIIGQVDHGIELARVAREQDTFCVRMIPEQFDLIGLHLKDAKMKADERGIDVEVAEETGNHIVIEQEPRTTLEVLAQGRVSLKTVPTENVIDIQLDDSNAPGSCMIFRQLTGLFAHDIGRMPFFFMFEDVYLFKPKLPSGMSVVPENTPSEMVPAGMLAITNDARKGTGMVGVRTSDNSEFGPTSEPFDGTNMIGRVIDLDKLKQFKENEMVYIREVRQ